MQQRLLLMLPRLQAKIFATAMEISLNPSSSSTGISTSGSQLQKPIGACIMMC
jgi:hypothetical protein